MFFLGMLRNDHGFKISIPLIFLFCPGWTRCEWHVSFSVVLDIGGFPDDSFAHAAIIHSFPMSPSGLDWQINIDFAQPAGAVRRPNKRRRRADGLQPQFLGRLLFENSFLSLCRVDLDF
jgi:hypothetical protein